MDLRPALAFESPELKVPVLIDASIADAFLGIQRRTEYQKMAFWLDCNNCRRFQKAPDPIRGSGWYMLQARIYNRLGWGQALDSIVGGQKTPRLEIVKGNRISGNPTFGYWEGLYEWINGMNFWKTRRTCSSRF